MKITRRFTKANENVFNTVEWTKRSSRILNPDGSVVFEMNDAEVPASWSQLATDICVSKYFRKAGVPQYEDKDSGTGGTPVNEHGTAETAVPPKPKVDAAGQPITGPERSVKQVVHRLAGCWRAWGEKHGYFDTAEDADAFYDELAYMLINQMAAPNSPQWFNTGLHWAYGISGPPQGHWVNDARTGEPKRASDAYSHPQPHACFIQSVDDDLVNEGGIMDLWTREARLFKYGSGTGTNFSSIRGEDEPLSGGGKSSGLMSFLKIGDRAAGAIKSGGTTRRAAKMVCLDADHPDIENFVNWKVREELKVAAMAEGIKHLAKEHKELADKLALSLDYDFNGEAYQTVSGQNSNNSVRLTNEFFKAVENDGPWHLNSRTDGSVARTVQARDLWQQICEAAWRCADPGVQYDSTINEWHTCPNSGRINASNPCSEYMFLDNTACNLASINLMKFFDPTTGTLDVEGYEHAIRLWTIVLEISVLMAAFPSEEIARQSYRFRTLGLGYANLGAMLMQAGIAYDSEEGRAICGALTSMLTGRSYATSAEMAEELGPFAAYRDNREAMLRVIRNHRRAAHGVDRDADSYEGLTIRPVPIDHELFRFGRINISNSDDLLNRATAAWDEALSRGEQHGYRNAQVTVIAPTGTIGLLMDCDTTGVEPDFALVKFKKLAGGGYFKIANESLRPALRTLGYTDQQIAEIIEYVLGTLSLDAPMPKHVDTEANTFREFLIEKGYTNEDLEALHKALPSVFELSIAFNAWAMPEHVLESLGIDPEAARHDPNFNGLRRLGLDQNAIDQLNQIICGTQTVEGAPHLKDEHLPVFDCANTCGRIGKRFIPTEGHIRMMSAAQPFITGAISKTINLPSDASVEDIADAYWLSWTLGLKANALYRDGSKMSQPLSTKSDVSYEDDEEDEDAVEAAREEVAGEVAQTAAAVASAPVSDPASRRGPAGDAADAEQVVERIIERPMRRRLPDTRRSITHRFNVAGHEGYLTVGLYDNGSPGELFITMSKEGSTIGGLMDSLGTAISVALQYGVPVESLVNKFAHQRFEPMGMTTNVDVPFAKSLVDYIFRWMGMEFIPGYREANAPNRNGSGSNKAAPGSESHDSGATKTQTISEDTRWSSQDDTKTSRHDTNSTHTPRRHGANTNGNGNGNVPGTTDKSSPSTAASKTSASYHHERDQRVIERRTDGSGGSTIASSSSHTETDAIVTATHAGLDQSNAAMQSDAPACDVCGAITVRNGTCYKCLNCGNSMGCS